MRPYIKEFLDKFVDRFEQLGIEVDSLILFGSQARGTAVVSSDIDIAVVMNESLCHLQRGILHELGERIEDWADVDLFFTTPEALKVATSELDTNRYIRDEGVVLWPR